MNTDNTIYCHGWSSGPSVWEPLCGAHAVLSPEFRAVAEPSGFLPALTKAVPKGPHIAVGWSLGGMVALEYAATQPADLKGLVLIGTTPKFVASDRGKGWPAKVIKQMINRLGENPEAVLKEFQAGMFTASERRAFKHYRSVFSESGAADFDPAALAAGLHYLIKTDLTGAVKTVSCPVLWIHGTDDAICPPGCLEEVPEGHHIAMLDGAGHVPHWSRVDDVRTLVEGFVDGL